MLLAIWHNKELADEYRVDFIKDDVNALQEEKALKKGYDDAKKECKEAKDEEGKKDVSRNGAKKCGFYNII